MDRTESGLVVPTGVIEEDEQLLTSEEKAAKAHLEEMRRKVEEFNKELEALDPMSRLFRKLDMLLMQWLPQQDEWVLLVGNGNHYDRRTIEKALGKAIAKRVTKIPYARRAR